MMQKFLSPYIFEYLCVYEAACKGRLLDTSDGIVPTILYPMLLNVVSENKSKF